MLSKKHTLILALILFLIGLVVVAIGYNGFANADVATITESAKGATQSFFLFGGVMLVAAVLLFVLFLG
jgi:uncharacterized membrane protein YidH (DUF202 family)